MVRRVELHQDSVLIRLNGAMILACQLCSVRYDPLTDLQDERIEQIQLKWVPLPNSDGWLPDSRIMPVSETKVAPQFKI
jgi:hypothetical protein